MYYENKKNIFLPWDFLTEIKNQNEYQNIKQQTIAKYKYGCSRIVKKNKKKIKSKK